MLTGFHFRNLSKLDGYGLWSSTCSGSSTAYRAWEWNSISISYTWQGIPIRPVTSVKPYIVGDANGDNKVNAADIVEAVNYMNGRSSNKFNFSAADMNHNGKIDKTDINMIKDRIFSAK